MKPYFLIFGFGYTAKVLSSKLISQGFNVIGTKRSLDEEELEVTQGIKLINFNSPKIEDYLSQASHILISIPPTNSMGDSVLIKYGDMIRKQAGQLKWLGYLSSTGVYGNHEGAWVDEKSMCIPHTPTAIQRLEAEQAWLSFAKINQLPLQVFRLSGIYGPGRNVFERLQRGKNQSIYKKEQVFCRIHVEDIVSVLLASMNCINNLAIYNVSDDEPTPLHTVELYASSLLQREPPPLVPFTEASLSPLEKEFYSNNRRVSNLKIKKELHITLKYPTFREGLTQIWKDDFAP